MTPGLACSQPFSCWVQSHPLHWWPPTLQKNPNEGMIFFTVLCLTWPSVAGLYSTEYLILGAVCKPQCVRKKENIDFVPHQSLERILGNYGKINYLNHILHEIILQKIFHSKPHLNPLPKPKLCCLTGNESACVVNYDTTQDWACWSMLQIPSPKLHITTCLVSLVSCRHLEN